MEDYKTGMGRRIKLRRKHIKLTQEEMAERLGISVKHFSEVERGITGLSIENLIKVSDILGLSLDNIIRGTDSVSEWDSAVSYLNSVPAGKESLIEQLIRIGIALSK